MAHQFEDDFIYGDTAVDAKGFDGLHKLAPSGQQVHLGAGTTPAALSLKKLDETIDTVKPGKPDFLVDDPPHAPRHLRLRPLADLAGAVRARRLRPAGHVLRRHPGLRERLHGRHGDRSPPAPSPLKTGGASTSIFAVKVGEGRLAGLTNGGIQVENVGALETKDARRWRCKWYVALALFSTLAIACLDGISSADVVA